VVVDAEAARSVAAQQTSAGRDAAISVDRPNDHDEVCVARGLLHPPSPAGPKWSGACRDHPGAMGRRQGSVGRESPLRPPGGGVRGLGALLTPREVGEVGP
jgi:hypothetical protein